MSVVCSHRVAIDPLAQGSPRQPTQSAETEVQSQSGGGGRLLGAGPVGWEEEFRFRNIEFVTLRCQGAKG